MARHPLAYLPRPISFFLGYRAPGSATAPNPPASIKKALTLTISLTFAFAGLSVLQSVFRYDTIFTERHLPGLITSYGASAILVYGLPSSPLAQPRALIGGHFISALTGIIIYNLFNLLPNSTFTQVNWLGGSLATAIALVAMDLTGTTHPPAGATAILPVVQADIQALGWNLLWIMLLSSVLLMCVGFVGNNILGRWPIFFIRPEPFAWYAEGEKEAKERAERKKDDAAGGGDKEGEKAQNSRNDTSTAVPLHETSGENARSSEASASTEVEDRDQGREQTK